MGGLIVFTSIVTALFTTKMYPEAAQPSLVALAINYTLLVPIYLNWVVKLLADLEMYIGAVERISLYIKPHDMNTCDNDTDENPCELIAIKPKEICEYRTINFDNFNNNNHRHVKMLRHSTQRSSRNKTHSLTEIYYKLTQITGTLLFFFK